MSVDAPVPSATSSETSPSIPFTPVQRSAATKDSRRWAVDVALLAAASISSAPTNNSSVTS